jgi:hypothetical protein
MCKIALKGVRYGQRKEFGDEDSGGFIGILPFNAEEPAGETGDIGGCGD